MDDASVTLNPSATITATATPTQPTCGMNNGSISVSPSGAGYTYVWSPGSLSGSNPTNLGPGTYSVTITETASGCMDDVSVTLNPSVPITVTATPTQPTCALNNGSISVSPSGGGYTYVWNPASVFGPNPTNLAPGSYSVTVTETATGCMGSTAVTLNPSSPVVVSLTVNQPTCGQNNGLISVMPFGPGYTYTWNPATISGSAGVNLPPGTYSVTVTQIDGGCMDDASVTLNPSSPPAANATANPAAICEGGSTQLTATGGGTYTWSTGQSSAMITVSPAATTTYSVTVNNSGCAAVANVTVTVNTVTATATASPATACSGDPVQLTATGGGTYAWSTGQTGSMITVNPTATTTYSVTVTNNGCTDVANMTVTVNSVTATATASPATVCSGDPVQLTATGGGTYSWSTGQSTAMITVNPTATTTYSVTVTNNGCTDVADVTVTINAVTATATADPLVVCSGDPVLLTATGGGTYSWSTGQTAANVLVSPIATTTYSVTVTNNGCTDVADVTVTVSTVNATAVANPNPICAGQSTVLTATGGGTYAWSTGQSGASITVTPAANTPYTVTVTNNGCTGTATINVVINIVNANITANPNPVCAGNATVLTATGGATYSWSTGQSGSSISVSPASTTTYSVTATNAGCTDIADITVTVNSVTANVTAAPATICDGASTVLTATGGGTYNWSTGQSGPSITVSPTATTTYSVTVTNNGCTDVADATVTVNSVTAQASASPTGICEGATTVLTATGGGTYSWSTGQIGASITVAPTATTTYMVTVTNNGCTDVASVTVNVTTVNANATANQGTVCAGQPVQLTATGGGTYLWSTGQPTATINAVIGTTTTFSVTVTNNGCTDVAMVTVNVNSVVATATASPSAICPGLSSTLTATGGGTYLWSTGQPGPSISVTPAATTTYSVTVTNGGCTSVANVTVNVSGILTPAVTASPATVCPGQPTVLTASGGDTYSWSTGQSGATITVSPSTTTTYTVTATDDGCTGTADITVIVDPSLTATASANPGTVCAGQTTSLTATGGGNYIWSDGQSGSPISVSPSATTTYTVTVTNNGCSGTANVTVNVTPLPVAGATANPAAICAGQTTSLTATGGGTYLWSNSQIGPSITVAPTATTTYTVTVTNNGCTATADVTVTVNPLPTPSAMAAPGTVCAGETASLTATGGGTYAWSDGQSGSPISVTPSGTTTYTVTVTTNGCTATASTTVTVTPLPLATALATPATICAGQTSTLTASGGGTYQWSSGQSGATIVVNPSSTTVYTVTVTNNGCAETAETTVTVNPLPTPTATASSASVCIGQSANLSATGGGTYSWSDGQSGSPVTVTPATTTTYTVTVTNNGCTGTADVTVTVNTTTADATAIPATICPGLTSVLTATGGGTYLWSTGQSGASINVTPAATTTYFVTVTNNGCTDIAQVTVNVENNLSATATANPNAICAGESATLFATGGGTYAWSTGQSGASISVTPSATTTYTVTVTNNGCTDIATVTVNVQNNLVANATANPNTLCVGQSTTLSATGGGTYIWSDGQQGASISVTPSATTTYSVTATSSGCTGTASVTVVVNPIPVPTASASPATLCAGQTTTLTATGGGTYSWSSGQSGAFFSVMPSSTTTYIVAVTNNGCSATADVAVTVNPFPAPGASASPAVLCAGESTTLTATGGSSYLWSTGQSGASISVSPASTTTYTVTATDNGCTGTASVNVVVKSLPVPVAVASPGVICAGQSATLTASGGSTYLWNTGQTDASISVSPLDTTTYSVTATSNGCTGTTEVTLFVNTTTATATADLTTVCPGLSTNITATGGGTYLWSTGETSAVISVTPLAATTYSVTVTNNGCTDVASVTVLVNNVLIPNVEAAPAVVCPGQTTTLTASGGTTYLWDTGATDPSISVAPLVNTTYSVTVTNNGCTGSGSVTVTVDASLSTTATASPDTICDGQAATLTATGGGAYLWSDGQTDASISVMPAGTTTYSVTVSNNGCTGTSEVTVVVRPLPLPVVTAAPDVLCIGQSTNLTATGGDTYLWEDGQTGASITVTPPTTTTYTVIANDDGCTGTGTVTVTVQPGILPAVTASPDSLCPGASTTLTATGGDTYLWSSGQSGPSIVVTPSASTTYTVTVTGSVCEGVASVTVTVNPLPSPVATANPAVLCIGESTTLTASGGSTYLWGGGQTGASIVVTPSATTIYSVTATDSNGCQASTSVTVTVNPLPVPTVTATPSLICAGDTTVLTATGGTSYLWSTGATNASVSVSPLNTTLYSVTVTNLGCTASASATVLVNPLPTALADPDTICVGESAVLTASGGDLYQWSTGQTGTMITVSPLVTTTYSVTVVEEGCVAIVPVTVTVNPLPTPVILASPPVICRGESSTLTVSGGTSFVWSTGASGAQITVSPLTTTSYAVTATENGCVGTTQTTVLVSQPPFAVVATNATVCNGPGGPAALNFSSLVTGGDQGGIWTDVQNSGATGTFPNLDFTGVTPGIYLFRYTTQSASAPCGEAVYEVNVEVVFCNCPSVATIAGGPLCNAGGTLSLSTLVQTNEPGAWSLVGVPAGSQPAVLTNGIFNATNADAGVYELRFTLQESPPAGCPAFSTQLISVEAAVSAGVPAQTPHLCFGENQIFDLFALLDGESAGGQWTEISAIPSSGGAFIAASGRFEATNQVSGIYRFRYLIAPGGVCPSDDAFVEVEIEPLPIVQAGADKTLDCVLTEVALDGSGSSTGTNIVYLWTTDAGNILSGANSLSPIVDASGIYQLLVTDQTYGCTATDIATVVANNIPPTAAAIAIKDPLCHNQTNGYISVTAVTGGSAPYLYSINQQPFTISPDFIGLSGGTYTLEIEDANGCRWETEVVLVNPSALSVNAGPDVTIFYGDSTVLEAVTLPLGGDYVYSWTPLDSLLCDICDEVVASPDSTTLYQVVVTDANGCEARDEVRVTVRIRRDVYIPNGFSPNNDGVNDVIMVYAGEGVEKVLEFDIYSRWGESVFYAANFPPNNPQYGWNGIFRNKPVVLDVYVYYVRILYKDGTEKLFKGDVMLMR
ncbi:MAG: gliding motility-associated C-terminal domain-containing protein [Saprospiraceae bacterium]